MTVVPALLISVSGGLITTRAAGEARLGAEFGSQIFMKPEPLLIAGSVLGAMAAVPGLPTLPFLLLAGGVGGLGWNLRQQGLLPEKPKGPSPLATERESVENLLRVEPLAIEVGLGLVKLVDAAQGGTLLKRIAGVRRQLASELGFVLPPVRVTDNLSLKPREYVVLLKGAEIARFELQSNQHLAINPGQAQGKLSGANCHEPAFGLPAIWIPADQVDKARMMGYTVVDQANVVATHLTELIRAHAHEVFSRQEAGRFLERVREENPSLVEDLTPKLMSQSLVQRVLQNLLRERVSIRDGVTDSRSAGRGRHGHQEHGAADRLCAPGGVARADAALSQRKGRAAGVPARPDPRADHSKRHRAQRDDAARGAGAANDSRHPRAAAAGGRPVAGTRRCWCRRPTCALPCGRSSRPSCRCWRSCRTPRSRRR